MLRSSLVSFCGAALTSEAPTASQSERVPDTIREPERCIAPGTALKLARKGADQSLRHGKQIYEGVFASNSFPSAAQNRSNFPGITWPRAERHRDNLNSFFRGLPFPRYLRGTPNYSAGVFLLRLPRPRNVKFNTRGAVSRVGCAKNVSFGKWTNRKKILVSLGAYKSYLPFVVTITLLCDLRGSRSTYISKTTAIPSPRTTLPHFQSASDTAN